MNLGPPGGQMSKGTPLELPDPREFPLIGLGVLVEVGMGSRSLVYQQAKKDQLPIPVIKVGDHSYRVRTRDVYELIGLELPAEPINLAS